MANARLTGTAGATALQSEYSISAMSTMYNVSLRALRFYEAKDFLHPVRRNNIRYYTDFDRNRLECILTGKRCGFSLFEIRYIIKMEESKKLVDGVMRDFFAYLESDQIENQIRFLEARRREVNEVIRELRAIEVK